jgi:hypothetical protein
MLLFPEIQKKAQAHIDEVVGSDRMPQPEDFGSLPYVRQIMKETLRCEYTCLQTITDTDFLRDADGTDRRNTSRCKRAGRD